jgi:hypothetical protein
VVREHDNEKFPQGKLLKLLTMCILCKIKNPQKYLHISKKSSTFALEIGTTIFMHSAGRKNNRIRKYIKRR